MAYKYRIYPTRSQTFRLENQFSMCRHLYNWNLEERINAYKDHGETISYSQQQNIARAEKGTSMVQVHSLSGIAGCSVPVGPGLRCFFCREKQGLEAPGFPRFKKQEAWDSITYPQYKERPAVDHIKVSKIGDIKIRYHRDIRVDRHNANGIPML